MNAPEPTPGDAAQTLRSTLPEELRHALCRASDLARARRVTLREEPLPTSLTGLDRLLGGGLPRGELVELVGRGSCGRFAAVLAALRAVTGAGEAAAFVDQGGQLDPQAAVEIGVDLERLLWLRPHTLGDSLAVGELLLHTGFPMIALDLGLPPVRGRAPLAAWLRLARTAAVHRAVVLVGSPYRLSGCAAGVVVAGGRGRGTWGDGAAPRLLGGLRSWLHLARRIGHADSGDTTVTLTLPDACFEPLQTDHSHADHNSEFPTEGRKHHVTAL